MRISDWSSDVCSSDLVERLAEHGGRDLGLLVAARCLLLKGRDALFQAFEIGQQQLGLDRLGIGDRVDPVLDMLDVVILETAQDVDDRVNLADVAEELVAQPFALRRAAHQPRAVDEGELGRRSEEEHTSELQSLMRISYAVFCLKKNKKTINI